MKITHPVESISDRHLMALARKYGTQTLLWRQKFIGLLPEVDRRKLYEKKGYGSIFEFGKRMAGLSEAQIRLALNLDRRFEDKPLLRQALVKGEVSINKLTRVASIATSQNEKELCESAKALSKASLDVLVKDMKYVQNFIERSCEHVEGVGYEKFKSKNGLFKLKNKVRSLPGQTAEAQLKFQLTNELKKKLNSLHDKGIDVNALLMGMLEKREGEIQEEKKKVVEEVTQREVAAQGKAREEGSIYKPSRYVSVKTKRVLQKEHGNVCAVPRCEKRSRHLHHTVPFSIAGSNRPDLLIPLCREHHDIVHSVNQKYVENKRGGVKAKI